jgi:hypothetical protein
MADPFVLLGVPENASIAQIRRAYRRLALRYHPDRNPGDPRAGERFKRIVRAYRAALLGPRSTAKAPPTPPGPRPDRYGCPACGDTFPFPEHCPRCAIALYDRHSEAQPAVEDARVTELMQQLEGRAPIEDDPPSDRIPVPGLVAATFVGMAALTWSLGPIGPALLFAGFAGYVAAIEGHRFFQPAIA